VVVLETVVEFEEEKLPSIKLYEVKHSRSEQKFFGHFFFILAETFSQTWMKGNPVTLKRYPD